jgi:DNA-binding Lrp family transcriptional regulator
MGSRSAPRGGEENETDRKEERLNEVLLSSRTRIKIAELTSRRPRTLRELARLTGLSIPGVLRHVEAMRTVGLIREDRVVTSRLPSRKLYSLQGVKVMDFSVGDLTILKVASSSGSAKGAGDLERQALDIMLSRRRIRDKARRLAKATDQLIESEEMLTRGIENLGLTDEERIILLTVFTEETIDDAERVLARIQRMKDARRSIDEALARAK